MKRVEQKVPPEGNVSILCITDKQFGDIKVFRAQKKKDPPAHYQRIHPIYPILLYQKGFS